MKKPYTADEKVMAREQAFLHTDEKASPPACCLRADCLNSICSLHAAYQLHTCCPPVYCLVSARFRPAICLDKPTGYRYSYTYSYTLSMQPACCLPPFALLHVAWNPVYPQSSSCLPSACLPPTCCLVRWPPVLRLSLACCLHCRLPAVRLLPSCARS